MDLSRFFILLRLFWEGFDNVYKTMYFCVYNYLIMRTNIDIDDTIMKEAKKLSGNKTKKEIVDTALKKYIQILNNKKLLELFGKVKWEGDLNKWRKTRSF